jgi:hypothetical protein
LHAYAHWRELILKPAYSRFAARTMIRPALKDALATLKFDSHWVAQEFIPGRHYCTYSVCHNGHITAIAFDFIQSPEGQVFALECNPRATSGVHLLATHPQFVEAFLNPQLECITPSGSASHMLATSMLAYGLPASIRNMQFGKWLSTFLSSDVAVLDYRDPLPFLLQFRSFLAYLRIARRNRITPLEASTFDIEWNGNRE